MEKILASKFWPAAGQFLATGFIHLGLVLLAWGPGDLVGFFSNPVRVTYAIIVLARAVINSWVVYITPPHAKSEGNYEDLARWHAYMFETILVLAAFNDRRNLLTWNEDLPVRWVGLGIYLIGWSLALWSGITWLNHLRREGERACENPVLLFEGPYKWIRYPSLLHLAIYCLGFAVIFRSWAGLVLMIPLIWGIINRINGMEKKYEARYKRVWALRRHTSKRLIPYLY